MKRVLTFLAILLLPLSVWAMTPIADTQLSDVTGQAGVSITADITMDISFDQMGWGDSDGANVVVGGVDLSGYAEGGWIGIDQFNIQNLHVCPRTDYLYNNNNTGFGTTGYAGNWLDLDWLTIDVVSLPNSSLFGTFIYDPTSTSDMLTGVKIGIGTWTMEMDKMEGNVVLGPQGTAQYIGGQLKAGSGDTGASVNAFGRTINRPAFDQILGRFYIGNLNLATATGGSVLITSHGYKTVANYASNPLIGSGVTIILNNVKLDYVLMADMAWGDIDGLLVHSTLGTTWASYGLDTVGYIGLTNFAMRGMIINGVVAIDVGTSNDAQDAFWIANANGTNGIEWRDALSAMAKVFRANLGGDWTLDSTDDHTFVSISFPEVTSLGLSFNVHIDEMGATVALGVDPTETARYTAADGAHWNGTGYTPFKPGLTEEMGDIYISGMDFVIKNNIKVGNPSMVQIFAH